MRAGDEDELTGLVDRLRRDRRRDPYTGQRAYSQAAREVADRCSRLIDAGEAAVAVPVLRKAVDRMTAALMYMDSSSGVLGNDLAYLMDLYARACRAAPPRPAGLAAWLVKLVCDGPGWPDVELRNWAPALGPKGLAEVTRLVDERAAATDPDQRHQRWAVRYLREQLAEVSGDVDRYVTVLAEDLVSADQYGRIVRVLAEAGRPAEAVDWVRRGLAVHPSGHWSVGLRDLLVRLLIDTGESEAAVDERRTGFDAHPTIDNFRSLLATVAETDRDAAHSGWAVAVLRERAARQAAYLPHLIDVLILAGDDDEAWHSGLPRLGELPARQRVELLELRRQTHPADVRAPYRTLIDAQLLDSRDKRRYDKAITLLRNFREAYAATGETALFTAYLQNLRDEHRRRPTFLAKLDVARLQPDR
ncbi:DUF6880 family protein [Micromonospora sp. NPDC047548]|uniref:DUF6880 family protein n=1 Tax=Micromonospora sp. NPDC047548 TaxID=3155624 RepID=UPI0033DC18D8